MKEKNHVSHSWSFDLTHRARDISATLKKCRVERFVWLGYYVILMGNRVRISFYHRRASNERVLTADEMIYGGGIGKCVESQSIRIYRTMLEAL